MSALAEAPEGRRKGGSRALPRACAAAALAAAVLGAAGCGGSAPAAPAEGVRIIASFGRQAGQLSKPRAVALSDAGELFVIDRTGRIQVYDFESGEYLRRWVLSDWENGTPTGIAIDPVDGTLWLADTHYQRILNYDRQGVLLASWGRHGEGPGEFIFPTDVALSKDGRTVFVTEYGRRSRLMVFTREGEFLREWGSALHEYADVLRPSAIAMGPDGRLYVADAGNHSILVFDGEGGFVERWGEPGPEPGQLRYPHDVAFDADGRLLVCEYGNNRVSIFEVDGRFVGARGRPGHQPGEFFMPWGVAAGTRGDIIVADTNNGRVQVLEGPRGLRRLLSSAGGD